MAQTGTLRQKGRTVPPCPGRHWRAQGGRQEVATQKTLLTNGPLVAENCLCDSCNAAININSEACLMECTPNPELAQYSDAATYIELSEASFRLLKFR